MFRAIMTTPRVAACLVLVLVSVLVALAGCVGTVSLSPTRPPALPGLADANPAVADSLAQAELLYREALRFYVDDQWEGAGGLLRRARTTLSRTRPGTEAAESTKRSLLSRVDYFLDIVARKGYAPAIRPSPEPALADTVAESQSVTREGQTGSGHRPVRIEENARVEKWLDYFCGRGRSDMARWLKRRSKYSELVHGILAEEGLPPELFYLAMIESGLNPRAYSKAHAAGMWQFISSRAKIYGLRVDWWVDERRDPEKATRAACAYMRDLYEMFGSWPLALAAYNSGEGRVSKARKKQSSCEDYWCLDLPRETENFVPKFMAALSIGCDPEAHGFTSCDTEAPLRYDTIEVFQTTDLGVIAEAAGTTYETVKGLNPALKRSCTPPNESRFKVRVPRGSGGECVAALAKIPPEKRVTWQRHRISKGETLSEIASAYGSSTRAICEVNNIRNPHRIRAGGYVLIPVGGPYDGSRLDDYADGSGAITYVVRSGDTVTSIARRHGKRTRDVLRWNGLNWNSRIYPGDQIKIIGSRS